MLDLRSVRWDIRFPQSMRVRDFDRRARGFTLSYREHGESNSFRMELDNSDKYFTRNDLFASGDEISFWLYFAGQPKILMGSFVVDDLDDDDSQDSGAVVSVEGLAVDCQKTSLKTPKARSFEGSMLSGIVGRVAAENSLEAVFEGADMLLSRKDQKEQTDLNFLSRLAGDYGFRTRIEGGKLYFLSRKATEASGGSGLKIAEYTSSRKFKDQPYRGIKKAQVKYNDPNKNKLVTAEVESGDTTVSRENKVTQRVDSPEEATAVAGAKVNDAKSKQKQCEFNCMATPEMKPPLNILVEDEGPKWNGLWHIESADHSYSKQAGYRAVLKGYKL